MKISVADLDAMPKEQATGLLADCCGSSRWASAMVAWRPFRSRDNVFLAADEIWRSIAPADWVEAFWHHPRIGDRKSAIPQTELGAVWAAGEQSRVEQATEDVRVALAWANREYERRFSYIFIVSAAGKSAEDILAIARERLLNDPEVELLIAAEEQRKITRFRLDKLLDKER